MLPSVFQFTPAVCAVKDRYQILVPVHTATLMWVRIGDNTYYDDSNGILRSDTELHRISVPMTVLDEAGAYTVCWREVIDRKPYFPVFGDEECETFAYRPIKNDPIHAYMIADAHGMFEPVVGAAEKFEEQYGKIDLLILNGDILNHSGDSANFMLYFKLAEAITRGEVPVIISRGNHDLRGKCAEKLEAYMPNENGNTFYSFRLGNLWGILLDCGEDKNDNHPEYNGAVACHAFRERETEYLERVISDAGKEYLAEGVDHRIVISHVPFTQIDRDPFNIEQETYGKWTRLLNRSVRPQALLSGHIHRAYITEPGGERDAYRMTFPTVVGSIAHLKEEYFAGCGILFDRDTVRIVINDSNQIINETIL